MLDTQQWFSYSAFRKKPVIIINPNRKETDMKNKKVLAKIAFFVSLTLLMVAFHGLALSKTPYKIGYVNAHSGFLAFMGTAWRDGFLMGIDEINQAGGINGHKLDVVVYDDESNVAKGVLAVKKLIETDKVMMIAGVNHSGVAIACAPIVDEIGVPFFATSSSRWTVAKPKKWKLPGEPTEVFEHVAKLRVDAQPHVETMYAFLKKLGVKKFAWMSAGTAFGRSAKEIMEATYKLAGLELAAAEEFGPTDSDMTSQLTRIKGKDYDGIIIYSAEPAGALVYKQARELGITKPIIADAPMVSTSILKTLGQYMEGLYICVHAPDIPDVAMLPDHLKPMGPVIEKVRKGIMQRYNHPADWINAQGYDGAMLVRDFLRRAAPDPSNLDEARAKITKAMMSTKGFVGAYAMGDMSPSHEIPVPVVIVKMEKNKKFNLAE